SFPAICRSTQQSFVVVVAVVVVTQLVRDVADTIISTTVFVVSSFGFELLSCCQAISSQQEKDFLNEHSVGALSQVRHSFASRKGGISSLAFLLNLLLYF